ncbi:hypothetical protein GGI12_002213 [Dipsacomyces acuminosporus]|nr:hypothetical protein GGI12_002213 [Dipsacomyces acuminosporus]
MNVLAFAAALVASTGVSGYPIYGYYPRYYPGYYAPSYAAPAQTSVHNTGAYDNGYTSSTNALGSSSNRWDNGFNAQQTNSASALANSGSSSFNQWSNNAWSNSYNNRFSYAPYVPRYW